MLGFAVQSSLNAFFFFFLCLLPFSVNKDVYIKIYSNISMNHSKTGEGQTKGVLIPACDRCLAIFISVEAMMQTKCAFHN